MRELLITRPDDWHVHLRDGAVLADTCADMARYFGRMVVMPNLDPPVTTVAAAAAYRQRILAAMENLPRQAEPLMTLYLTEQTSSAEIERATDSGVIHAVKLYPAGATTHSAAGVREILAVYPVLETMQKLGLPLLIHGEVTSGDIDIFDREKVFIDRHLEPLVAAFPELKLVLEHISTAEAAAFISAQAPHVGASITAHHLLFNRNHLLAGGIRPDYYCLPVLKRDTHQQAVIKAATSGDPRFFLGTDSAPHATADKQSACGCAGCYTAHAAIELYTEAFERAHALDKLEAFAAFHGADFYGLPRNRGRLTLRRESWTVPERLALGDSELTPLCSGEQIAWSVT